MFWLLGLLFGECPTGASPWPALEPLIGRAVLQLAGGGAQSRGAEAGPG